MRTSNCGRLSQSLHDSEAGIGLVQDRFRKRIRYDDIREVEKGRMPFHESGGIHWSPWGGWIWSVSGSTCVILRLKRGTFRVGTDDAEGLAGFLEGRIEAPFTDSQQPPLDEDRNAT